ncbi:MAG: bactofilin family protein [Treponema sp.]
MGHTNFIDDISVNTIVGHGSAITGDISISGFLRIDGDIDGNVLAQGRVIIGEDARIRGNIQAASVSVGGVVQGDIIAPEYVAVLSSGAVLGSIITKKLRVDESVILHGFCFAVNDQTRFEEAEKKYHNRNALHSSGFSS